MEITTKGMTATKNSFKKSNLDQARQIKFHHRS